MWTGHSNFQALVSHTWSQQIIGSKQYALCKKLCSLKAPLKQLNSSHFSHISSRADKATSDLKIAQLDLHDEPSNLELQYKVADLRKSTNWLKDAERQFLDSLLNAIILRVTIDAPNFSVPLSTSIPFCVDVVVTKAVGRPLG